MSMSSIGGASAASTVAPPQGPSKEIREGMKQLAEAVKSGDLNAAKDAYSSLTAQLENDGDGKGRQKLTDMLTQLGDALNSGDIGKARQVMEQNRPKGPPPGDMQGPPPGGPQGAPPQEVMDGMASLSEALQSGDLSSARSAYTSLTDLLGSTSSDDTNSRKQDFLGKLTDIGSALQGSDLSSAQKLFAALTPRGQGVNTVA
jgi:hypothetical protein